MENLTGLNEGLNFPYDLLFSLYMSIRNQPLDWGSEDAEGELPQVKTSFDPGFNQLKPVLT